MPNSHERHIVTFAIGGPLQGFYADLHVRPGENDSTESGEVIVRSWCAEHFPVDWASTYFASDGERLIYKYALKLLCAGRIERFDGQDIFHPTLAERSKL